MESKHLGSEEVFTAGEVGGEVEAVLHIDGGHDFVGPLAIYGVELVNLGPLSNL